MAWHAWHGSSCFIYLFACALQLHALQASQATQAELAMVSSGIQVLESLLLLSLSSRRTCLLLCFSLLSFYFLHPIRSTVLLAFSYIVTRRFLWRAWLTGPVIGYHRYLPLLIKFFLLPRMLLPSFLPSRGVSQLHQGFPIVAIFPLPHVRRGLGPGPVRSQCCVHPLRPDWIVCNLGRCRN